MKSQWIFQADPDHEFVSRFRRFCRLGLACALIVWTVALAAQAGDSDDGDPLRVGSNPAIASDVLGQTAVVWEGEDNDGEGITALLFDADGGLQRPAFQVNTTTTGAQVEPDVAFLSTGEIVVVWQSVDDGDALRIVGQVLSANGDFVGGEFQINENATRMNQLPTLGADGLGNFVVAWSGAAGASYAHFTRSFSNDGMPVGSEMNFGATPTPTAAAIAIEPSGDHLVVWEDGAADISGLLIDAASMPVGSEFQINATQAGAQSAPDAASNIDGTFTVVWQSAGPEGDGSGSGSGIFGRRVEGFAPMPVGSEFQINTPTPNAQSQPALAADADGQVLVTWQSDVGTGENRRNIVSRRVTGSMPVGSEFQINLSTAGSQESSVVATDPGRDFMVAWQTDQSTPGAAFILDRRNVLRQYVFSDNFESGSPSRWSQVSR